MTDQRASIRLAQSGDKEALQSLLENNTGLIWSVAKRFFGRGAEADDLYQLGCLGFIKAVEGFDDSFGTRFSTYAVPKIAGEIRRFLRDDGMVKVSRGLKERAQLIRSERGKLEQSLGREPTITEISEMIGLPPEEIAEADSAMIPTESLHQPNGPDGLALELVLGDDSQEERMLERVELRSAIDKLPEREQKVIALRFFHGLTQSDCARILSVSQVQVSRLERRAVEELRQVMS